MQRVSTGWVILFCSGEWFDEDVERVTLRTLMLSMIHAFIPFKVVRSPATGYVSQV